MKWKPVVTREFGLCRGAFHFYDDAFPRLPSYLVSSVRFGVHRPVLGGYPRFQTGGNSTKIDIPLWLPLSVVLGWIVIRELRWRETARAAALPSDAGGQSRRSHGIKGDNRAKDVDANPPQP